MHRVANSNFHAFLGPQVKKTREKKTPARQTSTTHQFPSPCHDNDNHRCPPSGASINLPPHFRRGRNLPLRNKLLHVHRPDVPTRHNHHAQVSRGHFELHVCSCACVLRAAGRGSRGSGGWGVLVGGSEDDVCILFFFSFFFFFSWSGQWENGHIHTHGEREREVDRERT